MSARTELHRQGDLGAALPREAELAGIPLPAQGVAILVERLEVGGQRKSKRLVVGEEGQRFRVEAPLLERLGVRPGFDELEQGVFLGRRRRLGGLRRRLRARDHRERRRHQYGREDTPPATVASNHPALLKESSIPFTSIPARNRGAASSRRP